jgi:hypothetical protein
MHRPRMALQTQRVQQVGLPLEGLSVQVLDGPDQGKRCASQCERLTIGAATDNDLTLAATAAEPPEPAAPTATAQAGLRGARVGPHRVEITLRHTDLEPARWLVLRR